MNKEEFKEKITDWMREQTGNEYKVTEVIKTNNIKLMGMTRDMGQGVSPTIYLDSVYEQYEKGDLSFEGAASVVEHQMLGAEKLDIPFEYKQMLDYETIKDKIYIQLINKNKNLDMLENVPHKIVGENLAVVYRIGVEISEDGVASSIINNGLLKEWKKDSIDYDLALKNTETLFPAKVKSVKECIFEAFDEEMRSMMEEDIPLDAPELYVISNEQNVNGAVTILYDGMYEKLKSIMKEDFYILPSSTHEFLAIAQSSITKEDALEMVISANKTAIREDEFLADSIYSLNGKELVLENSYEEDMEMDIEDFIEFDQGIEPEL